MIPLPVWAAPAALLLVAVGPMPYGYYGFLRLVISVAAAWIAWQLLRRKESGFLGWAMVGTLLLYNPAFPVHLDRGTWSLLNIATALLFGWIGWSFRKDAARSA